MQNMQRCEYNIEKLKMKDDEQVSTWSYFTFNYFIVLALQTCLKIIIPSSVIILNNCCDCVTLHLLQRSK